MKLKPKELDEYFEIDGYKAKYPGNFGRPEMDINCRCCMLQRARWALDEDELETLKERAEFFGLDKTKRFAAFREKYLFDRLPRYEEAILPVEKFTEYALNPTKQPDKALAFELALGYNMSNYKDLMKNIYRKLPDSKAIKKGDDGYGVRYAVPLLLTGPNGKTAKVLTGWIDDSKTGEMRLTTVYVDN